MIVQEAEFPGPKMAGWDHVAADLTGDSCPDVIQANGGDQAFAPVTMWVGDCADQTYTLSDTPGGHRTADDYFATDISVETDLPASWIHSTGLEPSDADAGTQRSTVDLILFGTHWGHCDTMFLADSTHTGIFAIDIADVPSAIRDFATRRQLPQPQRILSSVVVRDFVVLDQNLDGSRQLLVAGRSNAENDFTCDTMYGETKGITDFQLAIGQEESEPTDPCDDHTPPQRNLMVFQECAPGKNCEAAFDSTRPWKLHKNAVEARLTAPVVLDADGDGFTDIVFGNDTRGMYIVYGTEDGFSDDPAPLASTGDRIITDIDWVRDASGTLLIATTACGEPDTCACNPAEDSPTITVRLHDGDRTPHDVSEWSSKGAGLSTLLVQPGATGLTAFQGRFGSRGALTRSVMGEHPQVLAQALRTYDRGPKRQHMDIQVLPMHVSAVHRTQPVAQRAAFHPVDVSAGTQTCDVTLTGPGPFEDILVEPVVLTDTTPPPPHVYDRASRRLRLRAPDCGDWQVTWNTRPPSHLIVSSMNPSAPSTIVTLPQSTTGE